MKFFKLSVTALLALTISIAASAGEKAFTADEAYKKMLTLEGTWEGESLVVPIGKTNEEGTKSESTITYEVIANGSSLMLTYLKGTPMEMVSMYHQDGPEVLIHTHYCAAGNQPSMKFTPSKEPGKIDFKFDKGTNMDVTKDGHAHSGYMIIIDEDNFETKSEGWNNGKLANHRYTKMTRKK